MSNRPWKPLIMKCCAHSAFVESTPVMSTTFFRVAKFCSGWIPQLMISASLRAWQTTTFHSLSFWTAVKDDQLDIIIVSSTTYKPFQSSFPCYLRDLITVRPSRSTRSSALVTLLQLSVDSSLKITNRSFQYAALHLRNKLPPTLRVPY